MHIGTVGTFDQIGGRNHTGGHRVAAEKSGEGEFRNLLFLLSTVEGSGNMKLHGNEQPNKARAEMDETPKDLPFLLNTATSLTEALFLTTGTVDPLQFMKEVVSFLSSLKDGEEVGDLSELKSFVAQLDPTEVTDDSFVGFLALLERLDISTQTVDRLKEEFRPLVKTLTVWLQQQTNAGKQSNQVPLLESFIEKFGTESYLQTAYSRWNGRVGEKKVAFPFPVEKGNLLVNDGSKTPSGEKRYVPYAQLTKVGEQPSGTLLKAEEVLRHSPEKTIIRPPSQPTEETGHLPDQKSRPVQQSPVVVIEKQPGTGIHPATLVKTDDEIGDGTSKGGDLVQTDEKGKQAVSGSREATAMHQLSKPETLKLFNLDDKPVSYKEFARNFGAVLSRGTFIKNGNIQRLTVKLYPEHLGTLKIELVQNQGEIVAKIISTTQRAKDLLETQVHALRQTFIQQNINVTRIDLQNEWSYEGFDGKQESFNGSEYENHQHEEEGSEQEPLDTTFKDTLLNIEV